MIRLNYVTVAVIAFAVLVMIQQIIASWKRSKTAATKRLTDADVQIKAATEKVAAIHASLDSKRDQVANLHDEADHIHYLHDELDADLIALHEKLN
jgi:peptidoglycan hydrolase CwlO-like protein